MSQWMTNALGARALHAASAAGSAEDAFRQLFDNSPDGILLLDNDGVILDANAAFQAMFGYAAAELEGRLAMELIVPPESRQESTDAFSNITGGIVRLKTHRRHKDGRIIDVEILAYPLHADEHKTGAVAIYQDVTERERVLREMNFQASHDPLTGVFNRAEFERRLGQLLRKNKHGRGAHAFLYLNLDRFRLLNDICGYAAADQVLVDIARLLVAGVRESDVVARLGGDEFAVLLPGCRGEVAMKKAERFLRAIDDYQFVWEQRRFPVSASIGIVTLGAGFASVEQAMGAASAACAAAREKGHDRCQLYSPADENLASRRAEMAWVARLNSAIEENRFVLFYQEIVGLGEGAERHREILIRYRGDDGQLIAPGEFVPIAERYHLMPAIDRWVLENACARLAARCERGDAGEVLSVNVSGRTLSDERFPEFVRDVLAASRVNGRRLCFEITETAAISNLAFAQRFIEEVKALGCTVALDDFGSGMSSFNYLRSLPVDYLKIDGMFIREMDRNLVDSAMTEAINKVGKVLGLKTIAEFVETPEVLELLRDMGIDYAQGYGVHKPELWLD